MGAPVAFASHVTPPTTGSILSLATVGNSLAFPPSRSFGVVAYYAFLRPSPRGSKIDFRLSLVTGLDWLRKLHHDLPFAPLTLLSHQLST